jgi:cytoskeletal protein CcmA (bactofilin family)
MFNRKSDKLELVLGENSKITGDIESAGTILVQGTIIGNIHSEKVILGEKSYVKGNIFAGSISIAGKIDGCLEGKESVEVKVTGHISGDITARRLSIMEGAIFNGISHMGNACQNQTKDTDKNIVEFAAKER